MRYAVACAVLLLSACPTPEPAATESRETPKPKTPTAELNEPRKERELNVGDSCRIDQHCNKYLRCIGYSCTVPPAMTGKRDASTPYVTFATEDGDAKFFMETAITDAEMMRGLMYRTEMLDDWGMIFLYPRDGVRSFWMKNTLMPLDMVFVDSAGVVVGVIEAAEPLTLTSRTVGKPSRYVVELKAGTARSRGISAGTQMTLDHVPAEHRIAQ